MKHYAIRIQDRNGFERKVSLGDVTLIGRQSHCDIVLSDDTISRTHLRVEYLDGYFWAEDLASTHGTFQDGARIKRVIWEPKTVLVMADGAYRLMLIPEQLQASESDMRAILSTAQQLTGDFNLERLLQKSLEHLLHISGQERGFIMISDGDELEILARRNIGSDVNKELLLSLSSVLHVFDTGEPIWMFDVSSSEAFKSSESVINLQLETILCLPLAFDNKRIGVVYLDSCKLKSELISRGAFEIIVGLCAVAIERVRLSEANQRNHFLAAIGAITSTIAHDLKNAMFLISGHTELLSKLCTDSEAQYHIEQIQTSVERLTAMTSEVLGFARMRPIKKSTVDLAEFLNQEIEKWQTRAKENNIALSGCGPECGVELEQSSFARVINNLIANAFDSLANFGVDGRIEVLWESMPGEVVIKVIDNGKGIPKKAINKIFEPFFSLGKENGTGLGMTIVKKIVEDHGGTISAQSDAGLGTTITINLADS
jgi:signal transduction histidine kinase